jgi:hypothetical protein
MRARARADAYRARLCVRACACVCVLLHALAQASGAVHEAVLWSATRAAPRGEWFAFFALQGPLVCAEAAAHAALRALRRGGGAVERERALALRRPALPAALSIPLTWALVLAPACALFFPPPVREGLDRRVVASLRAMFGM